MEAAKSGLSTGILLAQDLQQIMKQITRVMQSRGTASILIVVLIILTFPIWIGIVGGLIGMMAGLIGGAFGIIGGVFGTVFGGLAGAFGWIFTGPLSIGVLFGKVFLIAVVLYLIVSALRTRKN